jgi:hypothetical protein
VEKYGRAMQATDHSIIQHMPFVCWVSKVTDTHSEYVILLLFRCNKGYTNMPQYYVYAYIAYLVKYNAV